MKPVIVVDGSSYLFRAYHAVPPSPNAAGEPIGAIHGVVNMLRKLLRMYGGHSVVLVFDPPGKTFRHDLYPAYKANRAKTPVDLQQQIAPLYEILRAMGFPLIIHHGVEADDVIGTLAKQADQARIPMIISTGDKDMAQLVNHNITLLNTMTDTTMDPLGVERKFGVSPGQIIDYLALVGDTADNIPGVDGIGAKTAAKLLKKHKNLDILMVAAEKMTCKIGANLRRQGNDIPLYRELVTIKTNVPLQEHLLDLRITPPKTQTVADLFSRFNISLSSLC